MWGQLDAFIEDCMQSCLHVAILSSFWEDKQYNKSKLVY